MSTDLIRSQQAAGFRRLRFCPELEPGYRAVRAASVRDRARLVSAAGLVIFAIFALLDLATLPPALATATVTIRGLVTCPVIALVWWLSFRPWPEDIAFERLYTLAYLVGGLSVVAIIACARVQAVPLPYEGMLLMLMFGYFAMGLPFVGASVASVLIIAAYLGVELATGLALAEVLVNLFFVLTANTIGMVGAWLSEYRHRAHFLDQQLVQLLHQSAREESARKSHLITVASHDLRQPLNVIGLNLAHLAGAELAPDQLGLVRRLQGTVGHFQRLLGTVLDISRINEGMVRADNQDVELDGLLDQLADLTLDHTDLHGFRLSRTGPDSGLWLRADPELLLRALQNLVFNAVDHSGGDEIRITTQHQGERVRVTIRDNGRGIEPALQRDMFQPFIRGATDPAATGLGLGLAIVRELTEMMAGQCGCESAPGAGTSVWLELPAPVTATPAAGPD